MKNKYLWSRSLPYAEGNQDVHIYRKVYSLYMGYTVHNPPYGISLANCYHCCMIRCPLQDAGEAEPLFP